MHRPAKDDVMTILYTSGSTGQPKGVVISYGAYAYASEAARASIDAGPDDHLFSYLPLAHITERTCTAGPAIYGGSQCSFVESLETFQRDLKRASPTIFISVPRLWVKFQSGVHAKISPTKLKILLSLPIVGRAVARKIRTELGFQNCRSYGSGSAPISPLTLKWYERLGVNIGEGWGMSETSGLSCGNIPFTANRIGTIGVPVDGTEMKLSDEGEILLRSPGLFTEYFKQPELTREVFTEDGFFHTGDRAEWDESLQAYKITGRVKDIFKSAKGKYVTPVPIESRLSGNPLLEQICVMGSGLPAPVAVVVLSETAKYIPKQDIKSSLQTTLEKVNARLETHERMSNIVIVDDEWTSARNSANRWFGRPKWRLIEVRKDAVQYQQVVADHPHYLTIFDNWSVTDTEILEKSRAIANFHVRPNRQDRLCHDFVYVDPLWRSVLGDDFLGDIRE
jgi:long-subunit acyl-CoA synthetase (AMP-forming)